MTLKPRLESAVARDGEAGSPNEGSSRRLAGEGA
jgi:hypothetical protein